MALRHDLELDMQKNAEGWNKFLDCMKRMDVREKDHAHTEQALLQRLTVLEGEAEKMRTTLSSFDSNVCKQLSDTHKRLEQHGKELESAVRDRSIGTHTELSRYAKDSETSLQVVESQMTRLRDEHAKATFDLGERAKVLELRCQAHEKDLVDHKELMNNWEYTLLDRVHSTVTAVDSIHVDKQANDAVVRSTAQRAEDLSRRMMTAESGLNQRVTSDQWKSQMDNIIGVIQKLDVRVAQLDRDMHARLSMEAAQREGLKHHLHGAIRTSIDKFTYKDGELFPDPNEPASPKLGAPYVASVTSPRPVTRSSNPGSASANSVIVVRTSPPPNGMLRAGSAHSSPMPVRAVSAWPGTTGTLTPVANWAYNPAAAMGAAQSPSGGSSRTVQAPQGSQPGLGPVQPQTQLAS